ncbi:sensor histidine kinase [Nonomuraea sp. NPDC050790]|uniref:sensor histidine kinase n=1 Tax=Nonomuraea sp. NPDC050790 TaxID=3364371 RepID=UPI0037A8F7A8
MSLYMGLARRLIPSDGERARQVLRTGEDTTRQAMIEMRHLLEALRTDGEHGVGTAGLPALVEESGNAALEVSGEVVALPALVDRVVQEALTNTRKHAAGAASRVRLAYLPGRRLPRAGLPSRPSSAGAWTRASPGRTRMARRTATTSPARPSSAASASSIVLPGTRADGPQHRQSGAPAPDRQPHDRRHHADRDQLGHVHQEPQGVEPSARVHDDVALGQAAGDAGRDAHRSEFSRLYGSSTRPTGGARPPPPPPSRPRPRRPRPPWPAARPAPPRPAPAAGGPARS